MKYLGILVVILALAGCGAGSGSSLSSDFPSVDAGAGQEFGATQGGAQDAGLARELIANGQVPPPGAFKVEGFFSEHDLPITGPPCEQRLCLRSALAVAPTLSGRESVWVQVGMSSSADVVTAPRPSLGLVALIDVSGSMGWGYSSDGDGYPTPARLARMLALDIAAELNEEDQFGVVTFGSQASVQLQPVTGGDQVTITNVLNGLDAGGSTNMEAGMQKAFTMAEGLVADGEVDSVRVLLLTDAQPNVGATASQAFASLAADAADQNIGLSVFGTGLGLDPAVQTAMAELRGGNAYSLLTTQDVVDLMDDSWPWFAVPLAYDLKAVFEIPDGFTVAQTFGFPDGAQQTLLPTLKVESVFPSKKKGALLARLVADVELLHDFELEAELSYETPEGEMIMQPLRGAFESEEQGQFPMYQQTGVAKVVALAILVNAMRDAAKIYPFDINGALTILDQAIDRFAADLEPLGETTLSQELTLAEDLYDLMVSAAPQGSLYGQ